MKIIKSHFLKIKGAKWIERDSLPKDDYFFSRENISSGKPDFEELNWLNWMVRINLSHDNPPYDVRCI